jgi:hypothetical protein
MDFSGALTKDENDNKKRSSSKGKVVFVQPRIALPLGITVDPLAIVLKDGNGGYWVRANLSKSGWKGHRL